MVAAVRPSSQNTQIPQRCEETDSQQQLKCCLRLHNVVADRREPVVFTQQITKMCSFTLCYCFEKLQEMLMRHFRKFMKECNHRRTWQVINTTLFLSSCLYAVMWSTAMLGAKSRGGLKRLLNSECDEKPTNNRKIYEIKSFSICAVGRM